MKRRELTVKLVELGDSGELSSRAILQTTLARQNASRPRPTGRGRDRGASTTPSDSSPRRVLILHGETEFKSPSALIAIRSPFCLAALALPQFLEAATGVRGRSGARL